MKYIKVSEEVHRQLKARAAQESVKIGDMVAVAFAEWVKKNPQKTS